MTIFVACILWCVHQNSIPTRPQPPNSRQVEERWAKARLFAATSRRVSKYCVILGVRLQQKKQWVLPGIPTICGCIPSSCLVRLHILCSYPNVWRLYTDLVERIPPKSNNFMYSPFSDQPQYQIVDCLISSYMYIYILLLHPQLVKSRPQCCAVWRQEQFRNLLRRKVLPGAVRDRIPGWVDGQPVEKPSRFHGGLTYRGYNRMVDLSLPMGVFFWMAGE